MSSLLWVKRMSEIFHESKQRPRKWGQRARESAVKARAYQAKVVMCPWWSKDPKQSEVKDSNGKVKSWHFGDRWRLRHLANDCKLLKSTLGHLLFTLLELYTPQSLATPTTLPAQDLITLSLFLTHCNEHTCFGPSHKNLTSNNKINNCTNNRQSNCKSNSKYNLCLLWVQLFPNCTRIHVITY